MENQGQEVRPQEQEGQAQAQAQGLRLPPNLVPDKNVTATLCSTGMPALGLGMDPLVVRLLQSQVQQQGLLPAQPPIQQRERL